MQIHSPSLFGAALPVEPSKPLPNTPAPAHAEKPNFAQMLNQRRAALPPAPPKSTEPVHTASTGQESKAPASAAKPKPADKPPARPAAKAPADKARPAPDTDAPPDDAARAEAPTDSDTDDATPPGTPAEAAAPDWLAALQRPDGLAPATPGAAAPDATLAEQAPPGSDGAAAKGSKGLRDASAAAKTAEAAARDPLAATAHAGPAAEAGSFAAALAEHGAAGHRPAEIAPPSGPDTLTLAASLQAPPLERRSEVAAALPLNIAAPPGTSEFREALGVQVSVLAKDGVERAELHLNPADMGPVSVHIVIDGTQARVDFGADVAATRHAIEAGLPELAAALRDAGFTLAGGGVSDHRRGRGDEPASRGDERQRDGGADAADTVASAPVRRTVSLGGLDLYA